MSLPPSKNGFLGDPELEGLIAHAAAQHPGIGEPPRFRELLVACVAHAGKDLLARAADLYLASACASGDPAAISLLDATLPSVIRPALARIPLVDLDEIVQRVRVALLLHDEAGTCGLARYTGRGELRGYLRAVALRIAFKQLERETAPPLNNQDEFVALLPDTNDSPDLALVKERCRSDLRASFAHALVALTPRERTLLRQHYIDGLTIDALSRLYQVHRSTCARRIEIVRAKILRAVCAHLHSELGHNPADLESTIAQVRSQLDLSLSHQLMSHST